MENTALRFELFGRFRAYYKGEELELDKTGKTKAIQLLSLMLLNRNGIKKDFLLDKLFSDRELNDPGNNMRVTIFKLKKLLRNAGLPQGEYILADDGSYYFSTELGVSCDVWEFRQNIEAASRARAAGDTERELELLKSVCELYRNEVLLPLSGEEWVIIAATELKQLYFEALKRLCSLLEEREAYQDIINYCSAATKIYPFDDWQLRQIDALTALQRYDEAMTVYQKMERLYSRELGLPTTAEMQLRAEQVQSHLKLGSTSVQQIYDILGGVSQSTPGAEHVNFLSFMDRFNFLCRISERSGFNNYLVSMTVLDKKTGKILLGQNDWADALVTNVLRQGLRRTDTYTRMNNAQYLILLVDIRHNAVASVIKRIEQGLHDTADGRRLLLKFQKKLINEPDQGMR